MKIYFVNIKKTPFQSVPVSGLLTKVSANKSVPASRRVNGLKNFRDATPDEISKHKTRTAAKTSGLHG